MNNAVRKKIKVIFIGDSECGKTALLSVFVKDVFPEEYEATVFNSLSSEVEIEGEAIELSFWDTSGKSQAEFDHVRPLSYKDTDVVVICFDISRPETLENVNSKWAKEVKELCHDKPLLLVGCKSDLRSDISVITELAKSRRIPTSYQQGCAMSKLINSAIYLECSAKAKDRFIQDIFEVCVLAALKKPFRKKNYKPKIKPSEKSLQKKSRRCIVA
ncbi:hypothetical protein QZH41_008188 [Actinostola sp. cb2023]|nr:hypothetical protein QZH41_008188 [Actinostola sp. cb2023]